MRKDGYAEEEKQTCWRQKDMAVHTPQAWQAYGAAKLRNYAFCAAAHILKHYAWRRACVERQRVTRGDTVPPRHGARFLRDISLAFFAQASPGYIFS